eukprot:1100802_1
MTTLLFLFMGLQSKCMFAEYIICDEKYSCSNQNLICRQNDISCNIFCTGDSSCTNTSFVCPHNKCILQCNDQSCIGIFVNGTTAKELLINCTASVCIDMDIFCSTHTIIRGGFIGLQIYAKDGWMDVELHSATLYGTSALHCGDQYQHICFLNTSAPPNQWNCMDSSSECYIENGLSKQSLPRHTDMNTLVIPIILFAVLHVILIIIYGIWWHKTQRYGSHNNYVIGAKMSSNKRKLKYRKMSAELEEADTSKVDLRENVVQ